MGPHGDAVKIRLQAPPVDGKANDALIQLLAARLGVPRTSLELLSGQSGRQKRMLIRGLTQQQAEERLDHDHD